MVAHVDPGAAQLEHVPQELQGRGVQAGAAHAGDVRDGGAVAVAVAVAVVVAVPGVQHLAQRLAVVVQQLQLRREQLVVRVEARRGARRGEVALGWGVRVFRVL